MPKRGRPTKKLYMISATTGDKDYILNKIAGWMEDGTFNEDSCVYEISKDTKVFKAVSMPVLLEAGQK